VGGFRHASGMAAPTRNENERSGPAGAYAAILAEARAEVAAGRQPDLAALEQRLRAASEQGHAAGAAAGRDERRALDQLRRVAAVHRARERLAREAAPPQPAPAPSPAGSLRSRLRTRPTITGNMDVRREPGDASRRLAWDAAPAVTGWEVRFSERPDPRADYVVRETLALGPGETAVDVPLGEHPFRVTILGRGRDGRLLRRALISSLTRETWGERWERRASAS
jgi:hypothetical protein